MTVLRLPGEAATGLVRFRVAVVVLACFSVWVCAIPIPFKFALTLAVLVHSLVALRLAQRRIGESLHYSDASGWVLERQGRAPLPVRIEPSSFVSQWLVILHVHDGRRSEAWCIARDRIDPERHRQLRVLLRLGRPSDKPSLRTDTSSSNGS